MQSPSQRLFDCGFACLIPRDHPEASSGRVRAAQERARRILLTSAVDALVFLRPTGDPRHEDMFDRRTARRRYRGRREHLVVDVSVRERNQPLIVASVMPFERAR